MRETEHARRKRDTYAKIQSTNTDASSRKVRKELATTAQRPN